MLVNQSGCDYYHSYLCAPYWHCMHIMDVETVCVLKKESKPTVGRFCLQLNYSQRSRVTKSERREV